MCYQDQQQKTGEEMQDEEKEAKQVESRGLAGPNYTNRLMREVDRKSLPIMDVSSRVRYCKTDSLTLCCRRIRAAGKT